MNYIICLLTMAAYDSVIRRKLWRAMEEFGIPNKLISLAKMTLTDTNSRVRIRNKLSEAFEIKEGLRQGDPLATLFFNLTLEAAVRTSGVDTSSAIFTKSSQLLGFADDLDVVGRNMDVVKVKFVALEEGASNFGLKVNDDKTEYMVVSPSDRQYGATVTINQHNFKVVDSFVYLGSQVNSKNDIVDEIRRRVTLGNRCYFVLLKLLRSKTLIRPIVTYGSESWCMTNKEEQILLTFERKILRTIFGPVLDQNRWRRCFNHELMELYHEPDISRFIKINRLRWLGHVTEDG